MSFKGGTDLVNRWREMDWSGKVIPDAMVGVAKATEGRPAVGHIGGNYR